MCKTNTECQGKRRNRNIFQTKEQDMSPETDINEMEKSDFPTEISK